MNNPLNPEELAALRLTDAERSHLRAAIVAHMEANPLPIPSPYAGIFSPFQSWAMRPAFAALALILIVGSGTALAAEGALPGDPLYPLKVNVIERVQESFAQSPEEKASFAVEITSRRLSEAAHLTASSTKDTNHEAGVRVGRAAKEAEMAIAELSETNPEAAVRVNANFNATLSVHSETLATLAASGSDDAEAVFNESLARTAATSTTAASAKVKASEPESKPAFKTGDINLNALENAASSILNATITPATREDRPREHATSSTSHSESGKPTSNASVSGQIISPPLVPNLGL